jgi:type I restriction enzyme, S subunit
MKAMTQEKLVPIVRFKEFSCNWETKNLGELLTERRSKRKISEETPLLAFAARQGVIDRSERKSNNRDFLTKDSTQKTYLLTKYDDIVYNPSNLKYGAIDRNKHGQGVISPIYVTFETTEIPSFIELIVKSKNFKQRALKYEEGTVVKRQSVKPEHILRLSVNVPSLKEQEKIGSFFPLVDSKIEQLIEKKNLLEQYKKGVMQKIFSQDLRFKDDSGSDYPDWEEQMLGDFSKFYRGHSYNSKNVKNSGLLVLRSSNIKMGHLVLNKDLQFVDKWCKSEIQLRYNDIVICMANGSKRLVGKSGVYLGNYEGDITVGAFCSIMRSERLISKYLLQSIQYRRYLHILLAGTNINNLKTSELNDLKFFIPSSKEEDKKIYNFLSSIDSKIELVSAQIENTKAFKKGLLQQMFVI